MMKPSKLIYLKVSKLNQHPRNMRRFYPADQVREMANSIKAENGVLEPLIVTRLKGKWIVVDGNMRLAGAKALGKKCPPLECKVVKKSEAEQLLSMVAANQVRYDVDPVSEGLHYKALRKEGLTVRAISKRTGVYEVRITNRLLLADLDEPIQKLITEGKFPCSNLVAVALLKLTPALRIKLATRCSENPNMKIPTILKACENLAGVKKPRKPIKNPGTTLSNARLMKPGNSVKGIRGALRSTCQTCNQFEGLNGAAEPAWSLVVHKTDEACDGCQLKEMQNICGSCPVVELLKKLVSHG